MFGSSFTSYKELHSLSLGISAIFVDPHSQYNSNFQCVTVCFNESPFALIISGALAACRHV